MFGRNNRIPNQQQPPQGRNEINYDAAIQTLKAMFTNVDESVLRLVLDTNGGRMETTVENLLQMTAAEKQSNNQVVAPSGPVPAAVAPPVAVPRPAPAAVGRKPPAYGSVTGHNAPLINSSNYVPDNTYPKGVPSGDAYMPPKTMNMSPPPANRPRQISTAKHDLPEDFLRPPSYWLNGKTNIVSEQEKEDEKLAKILQDSFFMAELQKHPEWVLEAQRGANSAPSGANAAPSTNVPKQPAQRNWNVGMSGSVNQNRQDVNGGQAEYTRSISDANNTRYNAFKSRMGDLGTAAKSRLAMLAERFKTNNNSDVSSSYQALGSDQRDEPPRPNQN